VELLEARTKQFIVWVYLGDKTMKTFKQFRSTKALRNYMDKHRRSPKQLWRERTRGINYGE
jgi:hypothetical protein